MSDISSSVKPLYGELQGYLSQAPSLQQSSFLRDPGLWEQLHDVIQQLNQVTGESFDRFKVTTIWDVDEYYVRNTEYRSKLNGLIMNLHSRYFSNDPSPFGGTPQTVVSQTQNQNINLTMIMEFQSVIDKQLFSNSALSEKEKTFLEKVKENLPSVKTGADLVFTVLNIAKTVGLDVGQLAKLLG